MRRVLPKDPTDIVWLQTSFVGDIVISTGAIALAAREMPGVRQHLVTTEIGAKALHDLAQLSSITVFKKTSAGTVAAFRDVKARLASAMPAGASPVLLLAHRSYRSSFLGRYLGYPSVAYREADAAFLATERVPRVAVFHEAARVAMLLEALGVPREKIATARPEMGKVRSSSTPELDGELARLAAAGARRLVGIAPGSVWGTKRWTKDGFEELARKILKDGDTGVVFVGAGGERALAEEITPALGAGWMSRVANLAGRTTLDDLRWLFPKLALLVSNDSSPIHFASALDVPTLGIFGATVPEMGFGPLSSRSSTVGVTLACRPCSDHGPQTCPLGHFKCMRDLTVEQVYEACRELLA